MDGQNRIREGKLAALSQARRSERGSIAVGEKLRVRCQPLPSEEFLAQGESPMPRVRRRPCGRQEGVSWPM